MVPLASLWLPILLSAVAVFVISSIIHMALSYHRNDYRPVPDEVGVQDALRGFDIPPGDYMVPCAGGPEGMKRPEFQERMKRGPVVVMTVMRPGSFAMGPAMVQWFLYSLAMSAFAAYLAGRALGPGADYLSVFRFAGTAAFLGYAAAQWTQSIWYQRAWSTTIKNTIDGLVYALFTGGVFGWLWPR